MNKIYLLKNTSISFAVALVYPFIISIFPATLRNSSLKGGSNECLYKSSKIIQFI